MLTLPVCNGSCSSRMLNLQLFVVLSRHGLSCPSCSSQKLLAACYVHTYVLPSESPPKLLFIGPLLNSVDHVFKHLLFAIQNEERKLCLNNWPDPSASRWRPMKCQCLFHPANCPLHSEKRVMSRRVSGPCLTHPMSETSWTLTWHGDMDVPQDMSRHL